MKIPQDILDKVKEDYFDLEHQKVVSNFVIELYNTNWNVGHDQLCRSILFLLEGEIENLSRFSSIEDPRDVIMEAEKKAGNPGHYFINSF